MVFFRYLKQYKEIGYFPVKLTEEAAQSALFHDFPNEFQSLGVNIQHPREMLQQERYVAESNLILNCFIRGNGKIL